MWFIGLLIGMILGSLARLGEGTVWGGMIGALAGAILGAMRKSRRDGELGDRIAALERAVDELRNRVQSAPATPPVPAEVPPVASIELPEIASSAIVPPVPLPVPDPPFAPGPVVEPPAPRPQPAQSATAGPRPDTSTGAAEPRGYHLWHWLTGGNALVRVGIVVLFFGVAFLLKYAYDRTQVPIELRLAGVAIGAIVLLVLGWRLRESKPVYGLALQGGGVGVLYLLVFGTFRLFHLIPGEAAFLMLVAIAVFSAVLAVLQNAMSLAVLGVSGGFLAPVLASTGSGSHVMLFSYYAVLNAGVLGIALFKAWRPLNVLGFVFTFGIGTLWGARYYGPAHFESTEPFLVIFFLEYLAVAVLFALRRAPLAERKVDVSYVDSSIVFGVPIVAFGLQTQLVKEIEYGAAWSAVGFAAIYLVLAWLLYRRHAQALRMLVEAFLAIGVIFATLAIPMALDGRWTSAAWALEGAAAYWVGARQGRRLPRVFGLLLQFAAGVIFILDGQREQGDLPVVNPYFLGCLFIALAALFSNRTIERNFQKADYFAMRVSMAVFAWGVAWWLYAGAHEIVRHLDRNYHLDAILLFVAVTCAAFSVMWKRGWIIARYPALALTPVMGLAFMALVARAGNAHPLAELGWISWPVVFLLHLNILKRHESAGGRHIEIAHAAGLWLLAAIGAWEVGWRIDDVVEGNRVWPLIAWALVPGALLALLAFRGSSIAWPVVRHRRAYLWAGALPLAAFLFGWTVYANFTNNGNPSPLPYVPLLNPLDIAQAFVFLSLVVWWRALREQEIADAAAWPPTLNRVLLGGAVFLFLNGILLRTLHHWTGIPYRLDLMLREDTVQVALSIFWTVLALVSMIFATRNGLRILWSCGAALMAVVVVKLFLLDLAKVGGLERIVLFIAVGILMLVIGYFSPLPPKEKPAS